MVNPVNPSHSNIPRGSLVSVTTINPIAFSWCQILKQLQKQERSFGTGLWFCVTALSINYSYFFYDIFDEMKDVLNGDKIPVNTLISSMWYIGACIGSIICGFNRYSWPARMTHYIMTIILFTAILLIFLRDYVWINAFSLFYIARFLAGLVFGFEYIMMITHIADNAWKMTRGYICGYFSIATLFAYLLGFLSSGYSWRTTETYHLWTNIMIVIFFFIGILMIQFTAEPLTNYLKWNDLTKAEEIFTDLCDSVIEPNRIRSEVCEKARMMSEDYDDDRVWSNWWEIICNGNGKPLIGLILLRLTNLFTLNLFFIALSASEIYKRELFIMQVILIIIRFLIFFIPRYSLDKLGRRPFLLISGVGSGILFIPFTAHVCEWINIENGLMALIAVFIHVFATFGIEPVQHVYATEAFPLSKRNASLAVVTCVEYVGNCLIIIWWLNKMTAFLNVVLILSPFYLIIVTILLFALLPETKSKSVRKCRAEFNKYYKTRPRLPGIHTIGGTCL